MSYETRISSARSVLEQHNSRVSDPKAKVDIDTFFATLYREGGTSEEALALPSYEDLQKFGLPLLLARQVANIFRNQTVQVASAINPAYVPERKAVRMTLGELVEVYDPKDADSAVSKRLKDLSGGKPFVVFNADNTVDKAVTVKLLTEIRDGFPARDHYVDVNNPVSRDIYPAGARPDNFAEINPLFPNDVLRNGEDPNLGRTWNSVPLQTRQLIYLARKNGELKVTDHRDAISVHNDAIVDNSFTKIATYCPKAAREFKQLQDSGSLPSLKKSLGNNGNVRKNDPFAGASAHKEF